VGRVKKNLYWVTDAAYQAAFLTTREGVVLFDAPPARWLAASRRRRRLRTFTGWLKSYRVRRGRPVLDDSRHKFGHVHVDSRKRH